MRNRFDNQLELLNHKMIEMGSMCEEIIAVVTKSLVDGDPMLSRKVHVLESAIQKNCLVEIEITGKEGKFLGIPKGLVKNIDIPVVFLTVEDNDAKETIDLEIEIAKISRVKKIRNALSLRRTK